MTYREPFGDGSILHVVKRGARGMNIVRDDVDRSRFARLLYFMNDSFKSDFWERDTANLAPFERPAEWPEREPIVDVLAWTLLDNHFHLILRVRDAKDVPVFMQKVCQSMSKQFNLRHQGQGSIFQGPYRSSTVDHDEYLRYLAAYVMVKNSFETQPGGLKRALRDFEGAWNSAFSYRFSSLAVFLGKPGFPILAEENILRDMFPTEKSFKIAAKDMLLAYAEKRDDLRALQLEDE